jgi:hypothetical protein
MPSHTENWNRLGVPQPRALVDARLQLHYAAQVVSAVGRNFLPRQEDDSHTNLRWLTDLSALTSRMVPGVHPFRAALDFYEFRLLLLDEENHFLMSQPLDGLTMADAYVWLSSAIAERTGSAVDQDLAQLHYELPADPLGEGATFSRGHISGVRELGRWFSNADLLLEKVRRRGSGESDVRCWPHHFDLAVSVDLGDGKSIGVGMSPGDGSYGEPYLYVSPWPYPKLKELPTLPVGDWHTKGFTSAVLTGTELVANSNQGGIAAEYIDGAISACRKILA